MADTNIHVEQHGRSIPRHLAGLIATLETNRAQVLSTADIADILGPEVVPDRVRDVIRGLRAHGWIVSLPAGGTYEFVPASSGPYVSGDVWVELKAALRAQPKLRAQISLGSAAFMRGFSERRPDRELVVIDGSVRAPSLERTYTVIHAKADRLFGADELRGMPVSTPERIIIEVALWSRHAGDLRAEDHWLRRLSNDLDGARLADMLEPLSPGVAARVGFLLERFGAEDVALAIRPHTLTGPVWIGSRSKQAVYHAAWKLYDSIGVATA